MQLTMPLRSRLGAAHPRSAVLGVLLALAVTVVAAPAVAQAPADTTAAAQQVGIGGQWFAASCRECHATSLADADFRLKWSGRSAYDLFEAIRSTMPEQDPGSLTLPTYAAIVAYLMKLNGMPVGTVALASDSSTLAAIKLTFAPASTATSTPR